MTRVDVEEYSGREMLRFYCVACHGMHSVPTKLPDGEVGETYEWNGNREFPTILPAVNIAGKCAVSIRDGKAYYHMTCSHDARGRTVDLPGILERINA